METKHTPGPWVAHKTIDAHDGLPECWQIDAEHDAVCTTQFCYAPSTEANARLIAASPDLLASCMWLEAYAAVQVARHPHATDTPQWQALLDAIAKATQP